MTKIVLKNKSGEILAEFSADVAKPLLKQIENAWVEIASACHIGTCGACMCNSTPEDDELLVKDLRGEPAFPLWEWEIMTCIGWVENTDKTIILETMT